MSGLLSSVGTILRYASNVAEDGVAKGTLKTLEDKKMSLIRADGSMLKLLGKYIVEPVVVISDDLKDVDEVDNILGLHMDMFTGYYMQVFDILKDQYGLSINVVVDTLATDNGGLSRVLTAGLSAGIELSNESDDSYDFLGDLVSIGSTRVGDGLSVEASGGTVLTNAMSIGLARQKAVTAAAKAALDKQKKGALAKQRSKNKSGITRDRTSTPARLSDSRKDLLIPNAIQRTIEITTTVGLGESDGDGKEYVKTIVIPITIKLAVIYTSTDNIINAIGTKSDNYSFSDRLDEYRAGAISLVDFVLASDLISKYKKNKLKDKDSLLEIINSRELSANSKMLTNGFAGFEKFYNMYLISPETKISIERELKSKLSAKGKDKFLTKANGLSVTVIDPDYERIKIMFKDVRGTTDMSFKQAVKKDKGGSDYGEIIKALVSNKPPAF